MTFLRPVRNRRRRAELQLNDWCLKSVRFPKEISIETISNITDNSPILATLSPFLHLLHEASSLTTKWFQKLCNKAIWNAIWDKNDKLFSVANEEIIELLRIILRSDYHCLSCLPRESDYWSLSVSNVSECMSSKRCQTIKLLIQ